MSLPCIGSLVVVLLCYSMSLATPEATRHRQRKNRLRGVSHQAVQMPRKLKKRQYYSGGPKGLEGFVLECEVQLKADFNDGLLSHNDFASFLLDYCGKSDYPGPACRSTSNFWSLDQRLQMIFASEHCDVGPKEQIDCLASVRAKGHIGYTGDTEKLCESTYRFLKPSGMISTMLRNDDFTDSPDDKKKKKKGSATKVIASSITVPSSEPTQESPAPKLGRDSLSSPSAAPTIYIPPAFVEGVFKPGVLSPEEQHQGRMASKDVSFGFGATIILVLVGTVLIVLLIRRFQFSERDNEDILFDPALEGDASILSDNSFMFGERKESRLKEGMLSNDSRESNHSVGQKRISVNISRFWQLNILAKNMLGHFRVWRNGAREPGVHHKCRHQGVNETKHTTPDHVDLSLPSMQIYQTAIMASDGDETNQTSFVEMSMNDGSDAVSSTSGPLDVDVGGNNLMRDEYYINEFLCESPEVVVDISPSPPSSKIFEQISESSNLPSRSTSMKNKGDSCSQALKETNSMTSLLMRPNLASFVRQMKAQLETSTDKDKYEVDELSSNSSEVSSLKFTVNDLKSQFEGKGRDEETIILSEEKPAVPTVKDLLSQFQKKLKDGSASVGISDSSNDRPSVKNLRGQFEPPSRRNKRRTSAEMSNQLQELRKQFE